MLHNHTIALRPIGSIDPAILQHLMNKVSCTFTCSTEIVETMEIPLSAYYPERRQYKSALLIQDLRNFENSHRFDKVLGIIGPDIFAPGMHFVFGEANPGKDTAVISLTRLMQEFYSLPGNRDLFFHRTTKEAVHELGHLFSMKHCNDPRCVMFFSLSLMDTDCKSASFCKSHQGILSDFLKTIAA